MFPPYTSTPKQGSAIWGFGLRVEGLGFRVGKSIGLGFRASGFGLIGFRVGFRV